MAIQLLFSIVYTILHCKSATNNIISMEIDHRQDDENDEQIFK